MNQGCAYPFYINDAQSLSLLGLPLDHLIWQF